MGIKNNIKEQVKTLTEAYYKKYYWNMLGFQDWEKRIQMRLNEKNIFADPNLQRIEKWINYNFENKKVLIVGAGTGAELFALLERGADVYAAEPYENARSILRLKMELYNLPSERISACAAEDLEFPNDFFDFVYCQTVLEHVKDMRKSINEMIRVSRQGGWIFIAAPNYLYPYEGHYKIHCYPPALPMGRFFLKLYLRLLKRPVDLVNSLNLLTPTHIDHLLRAKGEYVVYQKFVPNNDCKVDKEMPYRSRLKHVIKKILKMYVDLMQITPNQYVLINKISCD